MKLGKGDVIRGAIWVIEFYKDQKQIIKIKSEV